MVLDRQIKNDITYYVSWLFVILLMGLFAHLFRVNDFLTVPQHGHFEFFDEVSQLIKKTGGNTVIYYRIYFFLDALFGFYTVHLLYGLVKSALKKDKKVSKSKFLDAFMWVGGVAIIFDLCELFCYLMYKGDWLKQISLIKNISYFALIIVVGYFLLRHYFLGKLRSIARFAGTASISLLFIAFVYGLMVLLPQGATLVVELFDSWWNVFLLFYLLTFMAIMMSHYPTYAEIWWYGSNKVYQLKMSEKRVMGIKRFLGFGIIYYDSSNSDKKAKIRYNDETVKRMRRSLGILLYVAFFNILLRVASQYFLLDLPVNAITLAILVVTLVIYHFNGQMYNVWRDTIKKHVDSIENDKTSKKESEIIPPEVAKVTQHIVQYAAFFPYYTIICIGSAILTTVLAAVLGWSRPTLIAALCGMGFHLGFYIYFKICRNYLKYVFYSVKLYNRNTAMYDESTLDLFYQDRSQESKRGAGWWGRFWGSLSDNTRFLSLMAWSGRIALVLLILLNSYFWFTTHINPINIILLYIIFVSSMLYLVFKHVLYYSRLEESTSHEEDVASVKDKIDGMSIQVGNQVTKWTRKLMKYGMPMAGLVGIFLFFYLGSSSNDLHELSLVKSEKPEISVRDFLYTLQNDENEKTGNNYFYIGSYGGGLKANLWNMLLFYELDSLSEKRFFKKTVAMSGVSGGAVGIGNYASLRYHTNQDFELMKEGIREVGQSNVLSNELTYWLGRDFMRELVPYPIFEGKDRSFYSMRSHARNTGMEQRKYNTISYRDLWFQMYIQNEGHFPALITNTTSTAGKQGVANTLNVPDSIFSGADNILEFEAPDQEKSLTYFGAISTTNRFPLFSPTAKIRSKGHYLDGGYFDNSGLLSVLELHDYLEGYSATKSNLNSMNPVFINVINSKDFYISRKLEEWGIQRSSGDPGVGEFSAIIETVVSIDKLPRYVAAKIKNRNLILEEIFMPHRIQLQDVENLLKGSVPDPLSLMELIDAHNQQIDDALDAYPHYDKDKWGVVEPPLARLLSQPAERYQEAMIKHHPEVRATFDRILGYLETTKEVKIQDQVIMKSSGPLEDGKWKINVDSISPVNNEIKKMPVDGI